MRRTFSSLAAIGLLVFQASSAHASGSRTYAADGALDYDVVAYDASTDVVVPKTGGPYPLVIASHGWSASGTNQLGWAKHFATHGFVVAVPTFPSPLSPDTTTNSGIIKSLVTNLTGKDAAQYHVAPGKYGLEGHSAGGLATTVAAAGLSPDAVVLFDPVDKAGAGKAAYAGLCKPILAVFAESGSCNQNAEWLGFEASTKAELVAFKVAGSTHCDGENKARTLCGPFCGGGADLDRQAVYGHYATAFLLAKLKGDATAAAALDDATVKADDALVGAHHNASTCGTTSTPNDGGTSKSDASSSTSEGDASSSSSSSSSSGGKSDGGGSSGSGENASSSDAASDGSAGGCAVGGESGAGASLLIAMMTLVAGRRRARRASSR